MPDLSRDHVTPASASQLLRSLGLLVDGPVRWGAPVVSRSAGVYVVELDRPLPEAPIDLLAVRRWLERVPALLLDGERPSVGDLALRLATFWLAGEPIVYVGRTARAIGPRIAAIYSTPLGDARPQPAAHWLKALANNAGLRIWWAETDAHEEYEDALFGEIAGRQPAESLAALPGGDVVLPFANLEDTSGRAKPHGLTDFLRRPSDEEVRASTRPGQAAKPRQLAGAGRKRKGSGSPSRRSVRTATAQPPAPEPTYLSQDGVDRLQTELDELRSSIRPGVIERVKAARELGDLRENAEYESARKEQSFVEGRIQALEAMLRKAVIVRAKPASESVSIGSTVVVESDGEEMTFVLVGSSEADPTAGRLSYVSPVGQALLGRRAGDDVVVRLPRGEIRYMVREVR